MGYKWLNKEKGEFTFELGDDQLASACHLDNKKKFGIPIK